MKQLSFFDNENAADSVKYECSCNQCRYYSSLKEPRERSDGAIIYGYCFKDGDTNYSSNMGKGFAVFVPNGQCKNFKKSRKSMG